MALDIHSEDAGAAEMFFLSESTPDLSCTQCSVLSPIVSGNEAP